MTTNTNKAIVHLWLTMVWPRADQEAIDRLFAPHYTVNETPCSPETIREAVVYLQTAFAPATLVVDALVAEGDVVVARWSLHGIHSGTFMDIAATGKAVHLTGMNMYRVVDGQIVANHEQVNALEVADQLRRDR